MDKIEEKIKELHNRLAIAVINITDQQIKKEVEESNRVLNELEQAQPD